MGTFSTRFTELVGFPPDIYTVRRGARDGGMPSVSRNGDQAGQE